MAQQIKLRKTKNASAGTPVASSSSCTPNHSSGEKGEDGGIDGRDFGGRLGYGL